MVAFQFHLQSVEQESSVGGKTVMLFLVKKIPEEKGSVRKCVLIMQQPVLLLPKFGAKSSQIFTQSP
jgi:hypothetical protein